ncbi:MAG TPA: DUF134 domain-containing protein [Methanomicrobiales archaeon]|nr:DUF134 domain-containing protein [Methanomicrobiales archaeon]
MGRCRGRPRVNRHIDPGEPPRCYAPRCWISPEQGFISLRPEEVEILRLVDLDGLEQEEAASRLGVSRKTAWRDLHEARKKVADALVHGKVIEVAGCARREEGLCPRWNTEVCPKRGGGACPRGFHDDPAPCPSGTEETGQP